MTVLLKNQQEIMSNALHASKPLLVNPTASCTPGRSFLMVRCLKLWLRATMKSKRFNSCSFIKQVYGIHWHDWLHGRLETNLLQKATNKSNTLDNLWNQILWNNQFTLETSHLVKSPTALLLTYICTLYNPFLPHLKIWLFDPGIKHVLE